MSTQVQDVLNLIGDHTAANTGNVNQARQIRQVTQAVKYFKRKLNMPSDERTYPFYFSDDQFFNPVPEDYEEEGDILYDDPNYNISEREWAFSEYSELLKRTGNAPASNKWSTTTINGLNQLILIGDNVYSGLTIDSLDTVGNWVASGDAQNLRQDLLEKKLGDASLAFDIVKASGLATLTNAHVSIDVQTLFQRHGFIKVWEWMTDNDIDGVILKLYVNDSNYWTITATDLNDGSAFKENEWDKVGWSMDDAVATGSPSIASSVTKVSITFDLGASFVSAIDFRVDQLFTSLPDKLDLIYKTAYVGEDADGNDITEFTQVDDTVRICDYSSLFEDIIARRAALVLFPALRADKDWYVIYQSELKDLMHDWGLRFPKKRNSRYLPTKLRR